MENHPNFKFKANDVIVPKLGADVPDSLQEIKITDVRPGHYQYKGIDVDGNMQRLNPDAIERCFRLK